MANLDLNNKKEAFYEDEFLSELTESKPSKTKSVIIIVFGALFLISLGIGTYFLINSISSKSSKTTESTESTIRVGQSKKSCKDKGTTNGCDIWDSPSCPSSDGAMLPDWTDHLWNTPPRGDAEHYPGFQDMNVLVGYAQQTYNSDKTECTVTIYTKTAKDLSLTYEFDGISQTSNTKTFDSSYTGILKVRVIAESGETLELEEIDFIWNLNSLPTRNGDYRNGQKGAIVELFGWPDEAIEKECKIISEAGYLGIKLFPHMEQVMSWQQIENMMNPWYFMYQPVSYSLNGRMGNRSTLRKMIKTCRSYGLRVYADAVVNHMSGGGNDMNWHHNPSAGCAEWPPKTSSGELYGNMTSPYYTPEYTFKTNEYTGKRTNVLEFPRVPYGPMDFHCEKALNSWNDANILNTGWLTGLTDLDTSKDYVRQRIADYFVDLLSIGFTGFRVDAAKHIHPDDLAVIFGKFKNSLGGSYPIDFFTWLEVLPGGEADLLLRDSDYSYTTHLTQQLQNQGLTDDEINQIKLWWAAYPREPDLDEGRLSRVRKVIQNDDHDQQSSSSSSRDLGDNGCVLVKGCDPNNHRYFEQRLFTNPYPGYGVDNDNDYPIRMVLSSYYFLNGVMSPPDGWSDCSLCKVSCDTCTLSRGYVDAYSESAEAYAGTDYTRVHRDATIIQAMHEWMHIE